MGVVSYIKISTAEGRAAIAMAGYRDLPEVSFEDPADESYPYGHAHVATAAAALGAILA